MVTVQWTRCNVSPTLHHQNRGLASEMLPRQMVVYVATVSKLAFCCVHAYELEPCGKLATLGPQDSGCRASNVQIQMHVCKDTVLVYDAYQARTQKPSSCMT